MLLKGLFLHAIFLWEQLIHVHHFLQLHLRLELNKNHKLLLKPLGIVILLIGSSLPILAVAPPYYETPQNNWYVYSPRYRQYIDAASETALTNAKVLLLTHPPSGMPFEQGKVFFPGPTCIYLDGRFLAFVDSSEINLNALSTKFNYSLVIYLPQAGTIVNAATASSLLPKQLIGTELQATRIQKRKAMASTLVMAKSTSPMGWQSLFAVSVSALMAMLLLTRSRTFYRIVSPRSLLSRAQEVADLAASGLAGLLSWQGLGHTAIASTSVSLFLLCYRLGTPPILPTGQASSELPLLLLTYFSASFLLLTAISAYIYVLGLALFNIKIEESHIRANLELFSGGGLLIAFFALLASTQQIPSSELFRWISVYAIVIFFAGKAVFLYKILVIDQRLRKSYATSYICLTEVLPSGLLIRLLLER
jgi:hypothetical protein